MTRVFNDDELKRGETTPPLVSATEREPDTLQELLTLWDQRAQRLDDAAATKRDRMNQKDRDYCHDCSVRAATLRNCAGQLRALLGKVTP